MSATLTETSTLQVPGSPNNVGTSQAIHAGGYVYAVSDSPLVGGVNPGTLDVHLYAPGTPITEKTPFVTITQADIGAAAGAGMSIAGSCIAVSGDLLVVFIQVTGSNATFAALISIQNPNNVIQPVLSGYVALGNASFGKPVALGSDGTQIAFVSSPPSAPASAVIVSVYNGTPTAPTIMVGPSVAGPPVASFPTSGNTARGQCGFYFQSYEAYVVTAVNGSGTLYAVSIAASNASNSSSIAASPVWGTTVYSVPNVVGTDASGPYFYTLTDDSTDPTAGNVNTALVASYQGVTGGVGWKVQQLSEAQLQAGTIGPAAFTNGIDFNDGYTGTVIGLAGTYNNGSGDPTCPVQGTFMIASPIGNNNSYAGSDFQTTNIGFIQLNGPANAPMVNPTTGFDVPVPTGPSYTYTVYASLATNFDMGTAYVTLQGSNGLYYYLADFSVSTTAPTTVTITPVSSTLTINVRNPPIPNTVLNAGPRSSGVRYQ